MSISAEKNTKTDESISQLPVSVEKTTSTGCGRDGKPLAEGESVDVGQFWYSCKSGNLAISGCRSDEGKRVKPGDKFQMSGYEVVCSSESGRTGLLVTACLHDGKRLTAGETYEDKFFWYTCASVNNSLVKRVSGCMDESGKRVTMGNTVKTSNYIFQCQHGNNSNVEFKPIACLKDGVQYKVGEPFTVGQFWYSCTQENGLISTKLSGCVSTDGKRLANGEKYRKNGFVVECQISPGNSVAHTIVGCIPNETQGSHTPLKTQVFSYQNKTDADNSEIRNDTKLFRRETASEEKKLGETWLAGTPPFLFLVKCEKLETGAKQNLVKCHYGGPEGTYELNPGCFKMVKSFIITCYQRPDGGLSMNTVAIVKGTNPILEQQGLKEC